MVTYQWSADRQTMSMPVKVKRGEMNNVSKYEFDIDVRRGRVVVDAKSLLGIMHLGLNSVLELKMHSGDCQELEAELLKYAA